MIDSTGLAGQTIRSVYLSDKYPNFPKAGETDALRIRIKKNKVNILWNCYFTGDNANEKAFKSTYRKVITKAIEKKWSGTFNVKGVKRVKVKTKVWDKTDGKDHIYATGQKWSKITFKNSAGISQVEWPSKVLWWGGWSRSNPGNMKLFVGDSRNGNSNRYSKDNLKIVAAHEFGHILGIKDGYGSNKTKKINSIMCDQWGSYNNIDQSKRKATGKDIEKALDAYNSNKIQSW